MRLLAALLISIAGLAAMHSCCASALAVGDPSPPLLSRQFAAVTDHFIPDEGAGFFEQMAFDGPNGRVVNSYSTASGSFSRLQIANHTNASNGLLAVFYKFMGTHVCYVYRYELPASYPTPSFGEGMQFVRQGIRFGLSMNIFRMPIGKYVTTMWVEKKSTSSYSVELKISFADKEGLGNVADSILFNDTTLSPSAFDIPPECMAASPVTRQRNAVAPHNLLKPIATPMLYEFLTPSDAIHHHYATAPDAVRTYRASTNVLRTAPASVDHRVFATPIRNQGLCGGCWCFSSVAATEIAYNYLNNITVPAAHKRVRSWLSVQNVLDCVTGDMNGTALIASKGCSGGWPLTALTYIVEHGVMLDQDYTFDATNGVQCKVDPSRLQRPLLDALYIPPTNGAAVNVAHFQSALVEHGALVAIINVPPNLEFYGGGVYNDPVACAPGLAHAVTIVGYGTETQDSAVFGGSSTIDYWLVKNSFGGNWGEAGYFRIARGVNMCGIENFGFVPVAARGV